MRTVMLLLLAGLAACASSGAGGSSAPATQSVRILTPTGSQTLSITGSDPSNVHTVPYSVDQVWRMLPAVLDSLGVPVATLEPAKKSIGNTGLKVRNRLKGVPLSRFIDCGSSTAVGPNADTYDVVLTVLAEVTPGAQAGTARVTTTFDAVGKPANFSQQYSQCATKGEFERRFLAILNASLQR